MSKNTNYFRRVMVALAEEFERETGKKQVPGSPEWRAFLARKLSRSHDDEKPAADAAQHKEDRR